MNLELLDPQMFDIPESVEVNLDDAYASTIKFNRRGNYLAAGRQDGRIIIYDFDTKGIARVLDGHVKLVTSVSWSRDSRYLLSSARDCKCIVWDLLNSEQVHTLRFETPVLSAQFHPRNQNLILATFYRAPALLIDLTSHNRTQLPTLRADETENAINDDIQERKGSHWTLCARFNRKGDRIYTGTSQGYLNVIETQTRKIIYDDRLSTSAICSMAFNRKARHLAVNSNDRVIRMFKVDQQSGAFELQYKLQDVVNRTPWNECGFSNDGDYVLGGAGHKASHNIYIWDAGAGNLIRILEGPKEPLEDLEWHPVRPILASVSSEGTIYIWANPPHENWSALAPDFIELEENREYFEREDEFDFVDDELERKKRTVGEDEVVDVTSTEGWMMPWDSSDDELPNAKHFGKVKSIAKDGSFYLPIAPESDAPGDAGSDFEKESEINSPNVVEDEADVEDDISNINAKKRSSSFTKPKKSKRSKC